MGNIAAAIEHCDLAITILTKKNIVKGLEEIQKKREGFYENQKKISNGV